MNTHGPSRIRSDIGGGTSEDEAKDVPYDPYLKPIGEDLPALVSAVFEEIEAGRPTNRRSRADAVARRHLVLSNMLANLVDLSIGDPRKRSVIVALKNVRRTRYDRPQVTTPILRDTIWSMEQAGWLEKTEGTYRRKRTTVRPSQRLKITLGQLGPGPHVGREPGAETIILKARLKPRWPKVLVDYDDTEETRRLRLEMKTINDCLANADIRLDGVSIRSSLLTRRYQIEAPEAHRTFNKVGRLFGGFWQTVPRENRYQLTVDGEEVFDLDWRSMFPSLAYLRNGLPLPQEDPYAGTEGLGRDDMKIGLLALLCRRGPMSRLPTELAKRLGGKWTAGRLETAIRERHPGIADLFGREVGLELMATEGNVLVSTLLRMAAEGVAALGMHDGLLVQKSKREVAWTAMEKASEEQLGVVLPIAEKPIVRPFC